VSLYDHTFKWGLNYKFDSYWGKAPRPSKAPTQEGDRPPAGDGLITRKPLTSYSAI
jgi:hypothetical protein